VTPRPLLLLLVMAGAASAQTGGYGGDTGNLRQDLANRGAYEQAVLERHSYRRDWAESGADGQRTRRWGACVVAAVPADSRAFVAGDRMTQRLRWHAARCSRSVGGLELQAGAEARRTALAAALPPT
jgi:hypothetical protein